MSRESRLESIAQAIMIGDRSRALQELNSAIDGGFGVEEIVVSSVLRAHTEFGAWYERDPDGSLKSWDSCFLATMKVLRVLESKIGAPQKPPFSVLVASVKGEGHITTRDVIAILLKAKGLNIYSLRKGILLEDISQILLDHSLRFVILTCTEDRTKSSVEAIIEGVRAARPDVKIIAGGPLADSLRVDEVLSDPLKLYDRLVA
ncbi:MAG: cobalamin B12-binding domain-containing protein [Deltaproteobacteria bacterium]|nr:cobalamin B12-binding domain-containing protein [Deltaproteobacteria bacterium]